nr:MAG TPA: hypothetical protein [Caudoviricetes sp.]
MVDDISLDNKTHITQPDWISGRAFCCIIKGALFIIGAKSC